MLHTSTKTANDFPYSLDLIELGLQLIDLLQDGAKARYLCIGHLHCIAGAVVLGLRRPLCRVVKLPRIRQF